MSSLLNILWKKDSLNPHLYVDIFAIKGHEVQSDFQVKPQRSQRNNRLADAVRERGNELFEKKQYFRAMEEYNNSLAYAEIGTPQMGLAFANRSSCHIRLNMPMNAMTDIGLAKATNYPAHLMHKLNERYQKCLNRLVNETFQPAIFTLRNPSLSFKLHEKFDGVADCLKIERNSTYGRHIITKCDLEIGQVVLYERPFAIVPNQSSLAYKNRCAHCFEPFKNLITCEKCSGYWCYSGACTQESEHERVCNIPYSGPKHTFDLVVKMMFKIKQAFPDVDKLINAVESLNKCNYYLADLTDEQQKAFCSVFQMNHNHQKLSDEQLKDLQQASSSVYTNIINIADFKQKFVTEKHRRFLKHLILHLFHVAQHAIDLYDYKQGNNGNDHRFEIFGNGIYPIASYINHSCIPNVHCYASSYDAIVCQVIRKIKKGEQLFRSYFPPLWEFNQHRSLITSLEKQLHFKCDCLLCSTKNIRLPTADEVNFTTNKLYENGIALVFGENAPTLEEFRKLSVATIEKHEKRAIEFLKLFDRFHPINETINIENALLIMWYILVKDYSH